MDSDEQLARERLGEVINGKWTLTRLLGMGGMAAVYAAFDDEGRSVALKVLHPEMNRRADIRERFLREGATATRVDHPGVVQIHPEETGPEHTAVLVMELLDGEPLAAYIERNNGLTLDHLLDVLDQVLDVLTAAHDKGIIHRDLKPDNLFVLRDGRVKVLDFGIARLTDGGNGQHKTRTGMTLGTVPYMAPEQALAKHGQIDARTDLYALGAMAFRILTGRNIHVTETEPELLIAMASKPAPPIRSVYPGVPANVACIVDVALAFSKEARYPDARTMQEDVRKAREGKAPPFATAQLAVRDKATRTDIMAPTFPDSLGAPPSAFAKTEAMPPPSGDRTAQDDVHSAPTQLNPLYSAKTAAMPAGAAATAEGTYPAIEAARATPGGSPKTHQRRTSWVAIPAALVLLSGAGAAFYLTSDKPPVEEPLPRPLEGPPSSRQAAQGSPAAVLESPDPDTSAMPVSSPPDGTEASARAPLPSQKAPAAGASAAHPDPADDPPPPDSEERPPAPSPVAPEGPNPKGEEPPATAAPQPSASQAPEPAPSAPGGPAPPADNPAPPSESSPAPEGTGNAPGEAAPRNRPGQSGPGRGQVRRRATER